MTFNDSLITNNNYSVAYIGPFQLPDKNAAAHRVLNNAKILRSIGYNVIFIGMNCDKNIDSDNYFEYVYDGFKVYEIKCYSSLDKIKKFSNIKNIQDILKMQNNLISIFAYDYYSIGLKNLKTYCKKNSISLIADTDEWFDAVGNNLFEKTIRLIDSEIRMRILQPHLDGVITISNFLKDFYYKKVNTIEIPPLVDKNEPKWKNNYCKDTKDDKIIHLVYSGSPGAKKDNIELIINLLLDNKFHNKIILSVIGISKEDYFQLHKERINDISSSDSIIFYGRIPHSEALKITKQSDFSIFIRPICRSTKAGFPTKFVESISAGVPVITNKTSNISDYLEDNINGYFINDYNIEGSLKNILTKDVSSLKAIKNNINCDIFNYQNYIDKFKPLVKSIEKYVKN